MGFDLRRCTEAAVHAALAEAFAPPAPRRSGPGRRRRRRPLRALFRLVRLMLLSVGLMTTVRAALDPKFRLAVLSALAERFPIDDLLEDISAEVAAARTALAEAEAQAEAARDETEGTPTKAAQRPKKRTVSRTRGDTNGGHGRKPPSRGTRAA